MSNALTQVLGKLYIIKIIVTYNTNETIYTLITYIYKFIYLKNKIQFQN